MEGTPVQQLKKYLEPYSKDELQSLVMSLATNDDQACQAVLSKIKSDKKWCKLFVHGLAFSTSKETLESHYKLYGKVKEAVVLVDKKGNSKGYGFVTFENAKFALEAAKDPKKRIDNRVTHCNLAFKGNPKKFAVSSGGTPNQGLSPKQRENANDRRLFVHSLAWKTDDDSLADVFREYGELQEAVVIRDKKTGKSKGYGFVTFKYSESAQSALNEPNKKIDGRQTHCNYACERSNMNAGGGGNNAGNTPSGDASINSPNSAMNDMGNAHNLTSPNSMNMSMNLQTSNSMSSGHSHPTINTFTSNPLALNANISANSNSSLQRTNPFAGVHNPQQLSSGINVNLQNYHHPLLGMGAPSPQHTTRPLMTSYNPSYGNNSYGGHGGGGHGHSQGHQHGGRHPDLSHLISPNASHVSHDPTVSLLRNINAPQSPIPNILSGGIQGNMGQMGQMGLSQGIQHMLMRNTQSQGGGGGFPGTHPSNLVLGHSPSHHQQPPQQPNGIVVSGVQNNLFASPMPPQPPSTPPYAHVQSSRGDMSQYSPNYGGQASLSIPGFTPNVGGMANNLHLHNNNNMMHGGNMMQGHNMMHSNNMMYPPTGTSTKKIIATNGNMIGNPLLLQTQMNKNTPPQIISNLNKVKVTLEEKKMPSLKVANMQSPPHPHHHDEGNLSPKSQPRSDDEGEDEAVNKK